jgi:hypothetical protein
MGKSRLVRLPRSPALRSGQFTGTPPRHMESAIAAPAGQESQLQQLYAKISKLLDKAQRKGNLAAATELTAQLGRLHRLIEIQQANSPKTPRKGPWCNSLAFALGYTPRGLTRQLVRDLAMWMRREPNAPISLQACAAYFIAANEDVDRTELAEAVVPIVERFLAEIKPHLEGVINEVVSEKETDYSGVDFFGPGA